LHRLAILSDLAGEGGGYRGDFDFNFVMIGVGLGIEVEAWELGSVVEELGDEIGRFESRNDELILIYEATWLPEAPFRWVRSGAILSGSRIAERKEREF